MYANFGQDLVPKILLHCISFLINGTLLDSKNPVFFYLYFFINRNKFEEEK